MRWGSAPPQRLNKPEAVDITAKLELYPFRMTDDNMARHSANPNIAFWRNLKQGYDSLDKAKRPPEVDVCGGRYVFDLKSAGMPANGMGACPVAVASST